MKILHILQCTNLGGMEQAALLFMEEMQKLGIESEVISLNLFGDLKPRLDACGIPATDLAYRGVGGWRSFAELRRRLRGVRADGLIMTGHNLMATAALGDLARVRSALFIHYHHRGVKPNWAWRLIYEQAARRFRAIVFASRYIRDEALAIMPALKNRAEVVLNPCPVMEPATDSMRRAARGRLGLPADGLWVGNAGWLIARKRWDVFIEVASEVAALVPEARFLIAGDGPERSALEARARVKGLEGRIHWLGWQKNLADFYQGLDVMLFNSDWDAMGRTPIEAMTYGVATVASVVHGGLGEILNDRHYAYLYPDHDIARLTATVVQLLRDPEAARALGRAGRERIREVGDPRRNTLKLLKTMGFKFSDIPNQKAIEAVGESTFNAL